MRRCSRAVPTRKKAAAKQEVAAKLSFLADRLQGDDLFGAEPTVADFLLFPMRRWAASMGIDTPASLTDLRDRLEGARFGAKGDGA